MFAIYDLFPYDVLPLFCLKLPRANVIGIFYHIRLCPSLFRHLIVACSTAGRASLFLVRLFADAMLGKR